MPKNKANLTSDLAEFLKALQEQIPIDRRTGDKSDPYHDGKDDAATMRQAFHRAITREEFARVLEGARFLKKGEGRVSSLWLDKKRTA